MKNLNFESNNFFQNILDNQYTGKNNENITNHEHDIATKSYPESYCWNNELYDNIFRSTKKVATENSSIGELNPKIEKEAKLYLFVNPEKNKINNLFTSRLFVKKKRGREKKKIENKKDHNNKSTDNILRKIQVHYLTFIIDFVNDILRLLNYKQQFYPLEQEFKNNIKKNHIMELAKKTLADIVCNNISKKYKKYKKNREYKENEKNQNELIYEQIKNNSIINNILSENYIDFFKRYITKVKIK